MTPEAFDYTGFYTIVLTESNDNQYQLIRKIFEDCWSLYISNINLLTLKNTEPTALQYTFYPYTIAHCEQVDPVIQNFFINATSSFTLNTTMFPEKFRNFYKCPLILSTYNLAPHMLLTPQLNGSYFTDGMDGIIFRVLSQRLNFTPIVRFSAKNLLRNVTVGNRRSEENPKLRRSLQMV